MIAMKLSIFQTRKLFLQQQGLLRDDHFGRGKNAVAKAIEQLSYLQIDTISVVQRAHQHILRSRVSNAESGHLNLLLAEQQLFEYWGHAAAYLPLKNYRYSIPVMRGFRASRSHDVKLAKKILKRIQTEGPLQSRDFEDTRKNRTTGWWDWKPAKRELEYLFMSGDLMVARREGFQKVFDLTENVIPPDLDTSQPSVSELSEYLVLSMVNALGVATELDLGYAKSTIRRLAKIDLKKPIQQSISNLIGEQRLIEVDVSGSSYYTTPKMLEQLPLRSNRKSIRILSPFDNLIINRRRTNELFQFNYLLECYVPAKKRQYGYFVLPILWGDTLIARMDAKASRDTGTLIIHNLVMEPGTTINDDLVQAFQRGLARFAVANNCTTLKVHKCASKPLKSALESLSHIAE